MGPEAGLTESWKHRAPGICLLGTEVAARRRGGLCREILGQEADGIVKTPQCEVSSAQTWDLIHHGSMLCVLGARLPLSELTAPQSFTQSVHSLSWGLCP